MLAFICSLFKLFFPLLFASKKQLALENMALKRQLSIQQRRDSFSKRTLHFSNLDKFFFSLLTAVSRKVTPFVSLVKPSTLLNWYRSFLKKRWTFPLNASAAGHPSRGT